MLLVLFVLFVSTGILYTEVKEYVGLPPLLCLFTEENQYYQLQLFLKCDQLQLNALTFSITRLFFPSFRAVTMHVRDTSETSTLLITP